jgi:hypothetical protein
VGKTQRLINSLMPRWVGFNLLASSDAQAADDESERSCFVNGENPATRARSGRHGYSDRDIDRLVGGGVSGRDWLAAPEKTGDMDLDRLVGPLQRLLDRRALGEAAGQGRDADHVATVLAGFEEDPIGSLHAPALSMSTQCSIADVRTSYMTASSSSTVMPACCRTEVSSLGSSVSPA